MSITGLIIAGATNLAAGYFTRRGQTFRAAADGQSRKFQLRRRVGNIRRQTKRAGVKTFTDRNLVRPHASVAVAEVVNY